MRPTRPTRRIEPVRRWLGRPVLRWQTTAVVALSGLLYVGLVQFLGGFQSGDASETIYPAVLMAHGQWSCAYPASNPFPVPMAGPGFSLLSAALQWVLRLGFNHPFPPHGPFGKTCAHAASALAHWEVASGTMASLLHTSLAAWLALVLAGLFVIRQTPLGRTRQEWLVPLALSATPPVLMAVQEYFHPQDQLALALALFALGLWLRQRYEMAGVLFALAFITQQYTSLAIVIFVVLAGGRERRRLLGGFVTALGGLLALLGTVMGPHVVTAALLGIGRGRIHIGTLMYEVHVPELLALVIARALPLVAVALFGAWHSRRHANLAYNAEYLLGLIAVGWTVRLVLEINLFGYYMLATGATLVLRDIVAQRAFRGTIWLLVVTMVIFGHVQVWQVLWFTRPTWLCQLILSPAAMGVALYSLHQTVTRLRTSATLSTMPDGGPTTARGSHARRSRAMTRHETRWRGASTSS